MHWSSTNRDGDGKEEEEEKEGADVVDTPKDQSGKKSVPTGFVLSPHPLPSFL
jgi:hypothetical protein